MDGAVEHKFICEHCSKGFKDKWNLLKHNKTHYTEYRYVCILCWTTYKTANSLKKHNYIFHAHLEKEHYKSLNKANVKLHSKNNTYHCDECSYLTTNQLSMSLHTKTHSDGKQQIGNKCNRKLTKVAVAPIQGIKTHSGIKLLKCGTCSYSTNCYSLYGQHLSKHSGQHILKSQGVLIMKSNIDQENNNHLIYPANKSCNALQFYLASNPNDNFKKSVQEQCSEERNVTIQRTVFNRSLNNQIKRKHLRKETVLNPRRKGCSREIIKSKMIKSHHIKPFGNIYACPHCNYQTPQHWLLTKHVMIHNGEKPLKCPHCPYACIWHGNLLKHIKWNHKHDKTVFKPIIDTKCSDDAKQSNLLKTQPHGCLHCNFRTANKLLLKRHLLIMHSGGKLYKRKQRLFCKGNLTNHSKLEHSVKENEPEQTTTRCSYDTRPSGNKIFDAKGNLDEKCFVCPQCTYQTTNKYILTEHMTVHSDLKPYKCEHCPYATFSDYSLKNHIQFKHTVKNCVAQPLKTTELINRASQSRRIKCKNTKYSEKNPYSCHKCSYRAPSKSRLAQHLIMHTKQKPYKCGQCPYASSWSYNLKKHKHNHSTTKIVSKSLNTTKFPNGTGQSSFLNRHLIELKNPYACPHCNYRARCKSYFTSHLLKHSSDKSYTQDNRIAHIRDLLKTEKTLPVDKCQSSNLGSHVRKESLGDKPFACPHCKYQTSYTYRLARHLINHLGKKQYKCPYVSFLNGNLNEQMTWKDSEEEIVPYPIERVERSLYTMRCNKNTNTGKKPPIGCSRKVELGRNIRSKYLGKKSGTNPLKNIEHSDQTRQSSCLGQITKTSEKDPFSCPHSAFKHAITRHLAMHSGKKSLKCPQCPYMSIRRANLKGHMKRKHCSDSALGQMAINRQSSLLGQITQTSGKNNFGCPHCDYSTVWKSHFTRHLMVHSGAKPYDCEQCPFRSYWRGHLKKHVKSKHSWNVIVSKEFENNLRPRDANQFGLVKSHKDKQSRQTSGMDNDSEKKPLIAGYTPFVCPHCKYRTALRYRLARHLINHSRKMLYKCPKCPYMSLFNSSLKEHIQFKHTERNECHSGERSHVSIQSDKITNSDKKPLIGCSRKMGLGKNIQLKYVRLGFVTNPLNNTESSDSGRSPRLGRIIKKSGNDTFACPQCNYRSSFKQVITRHLIIHSGKKSHKCPQCPYMSFRPDNLKVHIKSKHSREDISFVSKPIEHTERSHDAFQSTLIESHKVKRPRKAPHACPHCYYQTHHSYSLKCHLMTHTGQKPLKCPHCPYACIWHSNLLKHIKLYHSREKTCQIKQASQK